MSRTILEFIFEPTTFSGLTSKNGLRPHLCTLVFWCNRINLFLLTGSKVSWHFLYPFPHLINFQLIFPVSGSAFNECVVSSVDQRPRNYFHRLPFSTFLSILPLLCLLIYLLFSIFVLLCLHHT